ncbi:hypothetical protein [Spirulina subsalsa]|uniref:hypothetical protein n=1 Tax=Spirulina subsalsa TaxID=54311 RepID=UPI0002F1D1B1|nr:hypothetical protein [Spirulina subsalsa]
MLTNDHQQELMLKKLEQVVSALMEERPVFKEALDYGETLQDLLDAFQRNLSFEEFNALSDEQLKKHSRGIMALRLLGAIGDSFTPEQMAIFEDAVRRK